MDPRDVNRINYNNYYVGQNLDFLIRSKMRSESLSTPLTNTPVCYDDQVSSKMALLGKRGYYDPGYIYGFEDQNDKRENFTNPNNKSPKRFNMPYGPNDREQYYSQKPRENSQEDYELEMRRRQQAYERDNLNNNNYNRERESDLRNRNEGMRPPNYNNDEEFQKEYNEYLRKKYQEKSGMEDDNGLNLPKTREQIQHDVYIENFKRQQLAKQMMMEDEMKYRQNKFK